MNKRYTFVSLKFSWYDDRTSKNNKSENVSIYWFEVFITDNNKWWDGNQNYNKMFFKILLILWNASISPLLTQIHIFLDFDYDIAFIVHWCFQCFCLFQNKPLTNKKSSLFCFLFILGIDQSLYTYKNNEISKNKVFSNKFSWHFISMQFNLPVFF